MASVRVEHSIKNRFLFFLASIAGVIVFSVVVPGSSAQTPTATISGTVTDTTGAVVDGAEVTVKNVEAGLIWSMKTDMGGRFRTAELRIGNYEVDVTKAGFKEVVHKGITLTVGSEAVLAFVLPVGQIQETVTVESEAPQVDTSSSAVGALVEPTQMSDLPLNGRNLEQLFSLAPGVQTLPATGGGAFYGNQENYSIAGSRPIGQQFLIDNTNFLTFWGHATGSSSSGSSLGVEGIAEFQMLTNTYSAQFGGSGAVINAATKSGTNSFHGSLYEFLRNSALDSRSPFDVGAKPSFRRNQFGASLGGPIRKDKAFFFVNYEGLRELLETSELSPAVPDANAHQGYMPCSQVPPTYACDPSTGLAYVGVAPAVAATLAVFPAVTTTSSTGTVPYVVVGTTITHENYFLGRMDYNFSANDAVFVRYVRDTGDYTTPFSGPSLPLYIEKDLTANHFGTIEERHTFSPRLENLARVSFMRPVESAKTVSQSLPGMAFVPGRPDGVVVVGATMLGPFFLLPYNLVPNHYVFGDDLITTLGAHAITAGISVERVQDNTGAPQALGGQWVFPSVLSFLTDSPLLFQAPLPGYANYTRDFRELMVSPYFNDEWKVTRRLTLNLGLRYEWAANPSEAHNLLSNITDYAAGTGFVSVPNVFKSNPTTKNFAPRVGFAWDPSGNQKTSIRGGFGIFYNLSTGRDFGPAYWLSPPYENSLQMFPTSFPVGFPTGATLTPAQPTETQGLDWGINRTPYAMQYNLNIQRDIGAGMVLSVGYVGERGVHLIGSREYNAPEEMNGTYGTVATPSGTLSNPSPNPNFGILGVRSDWGNSNYNGLLVSLNRRFANHLQTQISYTYSRSLDDVSASQGAETVAGESQNIEDPYNPHLDYGPSSFNRKDALTVSGVYGLPFHGNPAIQGWSLSGIFTASSGAPYNICTGYNISGLNEFAGGAPGISGDRPNLAAGFSNNPILGKPGEWFNPAAFTMPEAGTFGNLGRNTGVGPNLKDLDLSVLKDTAVPKVSDKFAVQFRAEFFNLPNRANYGLPDNGLYVGVAPGGAGIPNPAAGVVTNLVHDMRQIQFALKVTF